MYEEYLKNNPDLMFTAADKGNVTVCFKTEVCNQKIFDLIFDSPIYKVVLKIPFFGQSFVLCVKRHLTPYFS